MRTMKPVALEPRWRAETPDLKAFIKHLTASLEAEEDGLGLRQRKRKAEDQEKFARAVEAICCNFLVVALAFGCETERAVAVLLGNYASGFSSVYGKHFKLAVTLMEGRGLITRKRGHAYLNGGRSSASASTICPTPLYWEAAPRLDSWEALSLDESGELIVIGVDTNKRRVPAPADWLRSAEAEIAAINEHLRAVPLECGGCEVFMAEMSNKPAIYVATPHHRSVRRVFKGSIARGGRLYAGFWETMRREDRFSHLTIDGEAVVNVDYGQLFLRLVYALAKCSPPSGDLYDLTGKDHERDDWPRRREGVKKMVNALLSAKRELKQWPGGTAAERSYVRTCFPSGTKPRQVAEAIKERHSAIAAEWFARDCGSELHRMESDLLIAVMLRIISLGIKGALPMHDSVIVAKSDGELARRVMREEALRLIGVEIPVKIDLG